MIKTLWLQNYGPFKLAELELGTLTVLVGPNASGKSIVLGAFDLMMPDKVDLEKMRKHSTSGPVALGKRIVSSDLSSSPRSFVRSSPDSKTFDFSIDETEREGTFSKRDFPMGVRLQLQPAALRQSSYIDSPTPEMREDGYGLPTALAYMKLGASSGFDALEERTRAIVPVFEGLRFTRTRVTDPKGRELYGDELIFDMKGARGLSPEFVSDGTLFTLGLLTSVIQRSEQNSDSFGGFLFLIDEIERGLHPRALGELISHLRHLAKDSNAQILATSHSPYLLDALEPEEVRLTGFLEDGSATIRKLSDHPEFDRWKDQMTPGEFWSTAGEDWIR